MENVIVERYVTGLSAVNVSFFAGRNFQNNKIGIANLCAQILQNGSARYDKKHFIHLPMQYGGSIDIGVNDLFATFNIRGLDSELSNMVDLLFSMIFEPKFNDIDKQKKIIRELNKNTMNDPFKILLDKVNLNMVDDKFCSLEIKDDFNILSRDDVSDFYNKYYSNPSIAISSGLEANSILEMINSKLSYYNINHNTNSINYDYYSYINKYDEFSWKSNMNRMLMYYIVDDSPIYDILCSVYQYKINKLLRMDKAICCRNRCIMIPHGIEKRLFCIDVEFSNIDYKDEIISDITNIVENLSYTDREFNISKSQKIGSLLYSGCDPIKRCVFNSESQLLNRQDFDLYIENIKNLSFDDSLKCTLANYSYVMGCK